MRLEDFLNTKVNWNAVESNDLIFKEDISALLLPESDSFALQYIQD